MKLVLSGLLVVLLSGCGPKEEPHIFPGEPSYDVIPSTLPIQDLFKDSPKPAFSRLRFVSVYHPKTDPHGRIIFERDTLLLDTKEVFRRVRSISKVPKDPGQYIDHEINAAGLLNAAFLSIKKYKEQEIQFKGYINEVVKSEGRLFPLKTGNRMTLETRRWYQAPIGAPKATPALLDYSYAYEITKEIDDYKSADLVVPGKVFVIQYSERHPEGFDRKELYYSQTLGAVILDRQESDGGFTELRLVARE